MARRRKRLWTVEEKRSICVQAQAPGVSVAQVGQRYALNANLIHKWLRDPRFAPSEEVTTEPSGNEDGAAAPDCPPCSPDGFLAVEMVDEGDADGVVVEGRTTGGAVAHRAKHAASVDTPGLIEVELAGGHRLRITGAYDADALSRLLRALTA